MQTDKPAMRYRKKTAKQKKQKLCSICGFCYSFTLRLLVQQERASN